MTTRVNSVIVISDTHFGCKLGLCPDEFKLDEGGTYHSSNLQKKTFKMWEEFWYEWVPRVTKGEPYIIVHNGDAIDGIHHNSVTPISHNIIDQVNLAYQVLFPIVNHPNVYKYYHIRGTEAHVGQSGQYEEMLAQRLGASPDTNGNNARWDLWLRMPNSALIHLTHHIGTTNSAAYESTAVFKELVEAYNESGRWNNEPPDVVVRSHRHRAIKIEIPNDRGLGISLTTPGWQLKTPYVWRGAMGRTGTPMMGGVLVRCGDEDEIYTRSKIYPIERSKEEIVVHEIEEVDTSLEEL